MEKLKPRKYILPCRDKRCNVRTNKRYQSPEGEVYAACCLDHARKAYRLDRSKVAKVAAFAAAAD